MLSAFLWASAAGLEACKQFIKVPPMHHFNVLPIIEPRSLQMLVLGGKPQRMNKVKGGVGGTAEPGDRTGIGRDLRLNKNDVEAFH